MIGPSSFLVCKPKQVDRFRKVVDLHYDRSTLSFSDVNAVYFHELDSEPILLFRQHAFDDLKLKLRGRRQLVAEFKIDRKAWLTTIQTVEWWIAYSF